MAFFAVLFLCTEAAKYAKFLKFDISTIIVKSKMNKTEIIDLLEAKHERLFQWLENHDDQK